MNISVMGKNQFLKVDHLLETLDHIMIKIDIGT